MRLLTLEDIRDVYLKWMQRGGKFLLSKLTLSSAERTKSSFNESNIQSANYWIIPAVRKRWNKLITDDENLGYEAYVSNKFLKNRAGNMLSIGSGSCTKELSFARLNPHWEITCIDFSDKLLKVGEKIAAAEKLTNIFFIAEDIHQYHLPSSFFDVVLFNSSLHHFHQIDKIIQKINNALLPKGKLIINEYVGPNRLQYSYHQLKAINNCLQLIDKPLRKMFLSSIYKNKYYGSGLLRMIISDPSECVKSEDILLVIHHYFTIVEEKAVGGNLLMPVLKDIA
ncbi:MAG: class I SAM-dependent methyltransferase, partial [Chitinophagaceae bacterium]